MKTYDIINAGKRNRFVCNGRIVSNSGRKFQPQNLPRPPKAYNEKRIEEVIDAAKGGYLDIIDDVMPSASASIRGAIIASPGKKLYVADLANIEGRVAAWLAGEDWKIRAFREYDEGIGHDLYKLSAARAFGIKPEAVDDYYRQLGKVMELALQYSGGVGGFKNFASIYRVDLEEMANIVLGIAPAGLMNEASEFFEYAVKNDRTHGLSRRAFVACDVLKRMWRNAHPGVVGCWAKLDESWRNAVDNPGVTFQAGKVEFKVQGKWMTIRKPSGTYMCYAYPRVKGKELSFYGVEQFTRKWKEIKTYSGKLFENLCQSISMDVLAENQLVVDKTGYEIVLHVHDENITEKEQGSPEELSRLMATPLPWCADLPLAAKGFAAQRYRKD